MGKFIHYRGIKIRKFHTNIYRIYLVLMATPFIVGIGSFFYVYYFPRIVRKEDVQANKYVQVIVPASIGTLMILIIVGMLLVYRRYSKIHGQYFSRVLQRQMLARMFVSRNWVDRKRHKNSEGKIKEVIQLPNVYYRYKNFVTTITVPTDGKRYHEQLLKLGPILEQMYLADVIRTTNELGYTRYELLVGLGTNRLSIQEIEVTKTRIKLMKDFIWEFSKSPHMLIGGGTGGGKSFFLFILIQQLAQIGTVYICDPKNADLIAVGELPAFKNHVFTGVQRITRCLKDAEKEMLNRFAYMKTHPHYQWGGRLYLL